MNQGDLERLYDVLAQAIDEAGPEKSELFLAKLALLLADALDDAGKACQLVRNALDDL